MPAATQARTASWYQGSPEPPPHELLTTFGRRSGRGLAPERSVGASSHSADAYSASYEQLSYSQPLAVIHSAPSATPIWFSPPSSPVMVPIVWVPSPLLSHCVVEGEP